MTAIQPARPFPFVGDRLCIDFVNTEVVEGGSRIDLLERFDDLLRWCVAARLITASQAKDIAGRSSGASQADVLRRAVHFRTTLRGMIERLAAGRAAVDQPTLDAINDILRRGAGALEVVRVNRGYETRRRRDFSEPIELLVPVAEAAAELLSGDDLALVKKCQHPQCILFFYDTTRNHQRRWCSMQACGNRAKAAAHYQRTRQAQAGGSDR